MLSVVCLINAHAICLQFLGDGRDGGPGSSWGVPSVFSVDENRAASSCYHRLVGLVVKASASREEDPGFKSRLRQYFFGSSHTSDLKLALQWLPCQAPGVLGSVLGLVGSVSAYWDWVRWKV